MSESVHSLSPTQGVGSSDHDASATSSAGSSKTAAPKFEIPRVSADPVIEAENVRLHTIHDDGFQANYDGALLQHNPHAPLSIEFNAWESGHLAAQIDRDDWEQGNHQRAQGAQS